MFLYLPYFIRLFWSTPPCTTFIQGQWYCSRCRATNVIILYNVKNRPKQGKIKRGLRIWTLDPASHIPSGGSAMSERRSYFSREKPQRNDCGLARFMRLYARRDSHLPSERSLTVRHPKDPLFRMRRSIFLGEWIQYRIGGWGLNKVDGCLI